MNYLDELQKIEKASQDGKLAKARLEQKVQTLQEEQKKLQEELKVHGVKEEELTQTIENLSIEIEEEIMQCQEILK